MTHRNTFWIVAFVACIGCGGPSANYDATVQGTVTVDGDLASRGRVVFHAVDNGPPAYGSIFENGTYSLRVGQGDLEDVDGGKLKSGEYIVTVVVNMPSIQTEAVGAGGPPTPGARLTAAKYTNKETSDLHVTVQPGPNVVPLELEGAKAEETENVGEKSSANDSASDATTPSDPDTNGATTPSAEPESGAATPPATSQSAAEESTK